MSDTDAHLILPPRATIAAASEIHARAVAIADAGLVPAIDASAVEAADTTAYQIVLALVTAARERGDRPSWLGASEAFVRGARDLGLDVHLGLDARAG